ncbi:aldo/keto reductase [Xanthobacter flavus]|uniref:aldo/keto reductase n=1 Tax=Xanthobacter flavus TaxID=281 RepID=UPI001AE8EBA2|nr:aldo/keto reductase [Xanthobacter flavus]MBP2148299.1 aryl-alcohol dehydrogenase-like predicted oxidoreductase [Xanthobacter flavus]
MLEYRPLGRTGISVSSIALGTMTFGQQNTEAEGHAQLDGARDRGINLIDAAELYPIPPKAETQGATERIIASWLKARGGRDKVVIATKVVGRSDATYFRADGSRTRLDAKNINEAVERSLKNLGTDYIDLYQLHWPDRAVPLFGQSDTTRARGGGDGPEVPIEETLAALDGLVKAGKVRHIGLSNETAWGLSAFLAAAEKGIGPRVASVQNAYNLVNRTYDTGLAEFHQREGVGLLAYSPLAQGFLTGKYLDGARPPGSRHTLFNRGQRYEKPGTEQAVRAYVALAREVGLKPAQLAIAYVTSRPFVTANIIGATTLAQLEENLSSLDVTITPEIEQRIAALHQLHGNPAP